MVEAEPAANCEMRVTHKHTHTHTKGDRSQFDRGTRWTERGEKKEVSSESVKRER